MDILEGPFLKRKRILITEKKRFLYIYSKLPDCRLVSYMTIPKNFYSVNEVAYNEGLISRNVGGVTVVDKCV
jgi:hypothetical protein